MQKKVLIVLFLLLVFSINCFAEEQKLSYVLDSHSINIYLDEQGNAFVKEKYYLIFPGLYYLELFRENSSKIGNNLEEWAEFDERIRNHIGEENQIIPSSASIAFIEQSDTTYVELAYSLKEPIVRKVNETSRSIEFELNKLYVSQFLQPPFFIVPENTVIEFILPAQSTARQDEISPEAEINIQQNATYVLWRGYTQKTDLRMRYTYFKQIAPSFSPAFSLKELMENTSPITQTAIGITLIILIALIYFNKKKLEERINQFLIKNSEFQPDTSEEEID